MTMLSGTTPSPSRSRRPWWGFARHYLEMVVAMALGMALYPAWVVVTRDQPPSHWTARGEVEALAMATAMSLPMLAWMRFRGHAWRPTLEMVASMYAGFVVLFPLLWSATLDAGGVMAVGHVLMLLFMLVAMLVRRNEYLHHH